MIQLIPTSDKSTPLFELESEHNIEYTIEKLTDDDINIYYGEDIAKEIKNKSINDQLLDNWSRIGSQMTIDTIKRDLHSVITKVCPPGTIKDRDLVPKIKASIDNALEYYKSQYFSIKDYTVDVHETTGTNGPNYEARVFIRTASPEFISFNIQVS